MYATMTPEHGISERLISAYDEIGPARMVTALMAFEMAAVSLLASDALPGQDDFPRGGVSR